ncbi:uncharacterized protein LOC125519771 isoform X2 [Triticum urartu]|uniref:uncharacterized protein LOC125519771 isoform X2 n=1 Tax=Triticum urartu TaxID=4572 RepID=UPI002042F924|nr:uncharacterized protein LOC125519771 isoform X2 [Triticum urartu]
MEEEDENHGWGGGSHEQIEFTCGVAKIQGDVLDDQIGLTLWLSVKHVVKVVTRFDEYKRWLVSEIGFDGMLKLPMLGKMDLRMSAWIMRKVKVKLRTIVVDEDRVIPFVPEDFHKVFGVPCGNRAVRGRDREIKTAAVEFIKLTIGMNASPAHNLKAAKDFLSRDITEDSSKIEKDCFQISFVIFVMGYVLSSSTKYEHMTIDFWGALANTELISQFNLCEYAIDNLMAAVIKLQMEYHNKAQVVHLSGCHLFFQIFLLDNIDLGIFNMIHSVFPRIQCFDYKTLRQMITMARCEQRGSITYVPGVLRPADSVCYVWVFAASPLCMEGKSCPSSPKQPSSRMSVTPKYQTSKVRLDGKTGPFNYLGDPMAAHKLVGPSDFSKYVRQICKDDPALRELSLMLKQHNAKCMLSTTLLRNQLQSDMFFFAEKMVELVKDRCRCYSNRGLSKCISLQNAGLYCSSAYI